MFTDPQSVTVNAVAKSLPRVDVGNRKATYESSADGMTFTLTHVKGKRNRHTVRLDFEKIAADPFTSGLSKTVSMSVYLIADAPESGFTLAEQKLNVKALCDWFNTSTNTDKVLAGES